MLKRNSPYQPSPPHNYCIMERECIHKLCSTKFYSRDGNKVRRVHLALSGLEWEMLCLWKSVKEIGLWVVFGLCSLKWEDDMFSLCLESLLFQWANSYQRATVDLSTLRDNCFRQRKHGFLGSVPESFSFTTPHIIPVRGKTNII